MMEQFEEEYVSILLEWSRINGAIFNISAIPQVVASIARGLSTSYQLNVSYNTQYNVSVVATVCGQSHMTIIDLNYGELCMQSTIFSI